MKKYSILALTLALCGALLMGCGCTNTDTGATTVPSTSSVPTMPTTQATTAPTTMPTTLPATEPSTNVTEGTGNGTTDGTGETAGNNGIVGEDATGEGQAPAGRSRGIAPIG